jgi:SAM-dependent methyltransferase
MSSAELAEPTELRDEPAEPWVDDPYGRALRTGRGPLFLRRSDGWLLPLDVERWCAEPDAADTALLDRCRGPVLDIGCGPGRLVVALPRHGLSALGVDVSPAAVARTRDAGGPVLRRSVFDRLPAEGRWGTALLVDGNIGIGGDPHALLTRVRALVAPGGRLLAEAAAHDVDERLTVRVQDARGRHGREFPWARLGPAALVRTAAVTGWTPADQWTVDGRTFIELQADAGSSGSVAPGEGGAAGPQEPPQGVPGHGEGGDGAEGDHQVPSVVQGQDGGVGPGPGA